MIGLSSYAPRAIVDNNGKLHICYTEGLLFELYYRTNASGNWVNTTVVTGDAYNFSLARNNAGHNYIAYSKTSDNRVFLATDATGSWTSEIIDTPQSGSVTSTDIVIDSHGSIHLVYSNWFDMFTIELVYVTNSTGSWQRTVLAARGTIGWQPAIALDNSDHVHVSYTDLHAGSQEATVLYQNNVAGTWSTPVVVDTSQGSYSSIAVDRSNSKVHIAYRHDKLKYAMNAYGYWLTTTVDDNIGTNFMWTNTSLKLNNSGKACISYYDSILNALKYASEQ